MYGALKTTWDNLYKTSTPVQRFRRVPQKKPRHAGDGKTNQATSPSPFPLLRINTQSNVHLTLLKY